MGEYEKKICFTSQNGRRKNLISFPSAKHTQKNSSRSHPRSFCPIIKKSSPSGRQHRKALIIYHCCHSMRAVMRALFAKTEEENWTRRFDDEKIRTKARQVMPLREKSRARLHKPTLEFPTEFQFFPFFIHWHRFRWKKSILKMRIFRNKKEEKRGAFVFKHCCHCMLCHILHNHDGRLLNENGLLGGKGDCKWKGANFLQNF